MLLLLFKLTGLRFKFGSWIYLYLLCVGLMVGLLLYVYFYLKYFKLLKFKLWNWIIVFIFILSILSC